MENYDYYVSFCCVFRLDLPATVVVDDDGVVVVQMHGSMFHNNGLSFSMLFACLSLSSLTVTLYNRQTIYKKRARKIGFVFFLFYFRLYWFIYFFGYFICYIFIDFIYNLLQPHESGFVLLGDLTLDSSTDNDDAYQMVNLNFNLL